MTRWTAFLLALFVAHTAAAQTLVEEQEPNDVPATAAEAIGPFVFSGQLQTDQDQDALIWRVPEDLSAAPWTLKIDGLEERRTLVWIIDLDYEDPTRQQILGRKNLATFGVQPLDRSRTIEGLLFPAGEYLIGVSSLADPSFSEKEPAVDIRYALGPLTETGAIPFDDNTEAWGIDTYDVSFSAGKSITWREASEISDGVSVFSIRSTLDATAETQEATIEFSITEAQTEQRWSLTGTGEIGADINYRLERASGEELAKGLATTAQIFELGNLVLAEGDYVLRLKSGRGNLGRFQTNLTATGVVVEGEEAEPNDSIALANQFDISTGARGTGDRDNFQFELTAEGAGSAYNIDLDITDGEGSLCLYDGDATSIQCTDGSGVVSLPNLHLPAGRYFIEARLAEASTYEISVNPTDVAQKRLEREPNDTAPFANDMGTSKVIKGDFGRPRDYDFVSFEVTDANVLYRIDTKGISQFVLIDDLGQQLVERRGAVDGEFRFDHLDLLPGRYLMRLHGAPESSYRVVVRNLGDIPKDFEREPNDVLENALRLNFGEPRRGLLGGGDLSDAYAFSLQGSEQINLEITAPEDQSLNVNLNRVHVKGSAVTPLGDRGKIEAGETLQYNARLHAGFYYVAIYPGEKLLAASPYTVSIDLGEPDPNRTDHEPNNWIGDAHEIPPGGHMVGDAGGIGGFDWYKSKVPNQGVMIRDCRDDSTVAVTGFTDSLHIEPEMYSSTSRKFFAEQILPENGGIYFTYFRDHPYDCLQFYDSHDYAQYPKTLSPASPQEIDSLVIKTPTAIDLTFSAWNEIIELKLSDDETFARIQCISPDSGATEKWVFNGGGGSQFDWTVGDMHYLPFVPKNGQNSVLVNLKESDAFPAKAQCTVIPGSSLQAWPPVAEEPSWQAGDVVLAQTTGEAWADHGQELNGEVTLENTGDDPLSLTLAASTSGRSWKTLDVPSVVTVQGGAAKIIPFRVIIPPGATALTPARVSIVVSDGTTERTVFSKPVQLDPNTLANSEISVFETPEDLLGGIDVLNQALGAKVVTLDGQPVAEDFTTRISDGRSPVMDVGKLATETVFRLAGTEPSIAGLGFSLRLDTKPEFWARHVAVDLSMDGKMWNRAAEVELAQVANRQFVVFDQAVKAQFLRLTILGSYSAAHSAHWELAEVLAVTTPGVVPDGLPDMDIAAPEWGGHLLAGELPTPYAYNATNPDAAVVLKAKEETAPDRHWIMGFQETRVARITGFEWQAGTGTEKDGQASEIAVFIANDLLGTFTALTVLTGPGRVDLDQPVFARFVKFVLPDGELYLPNRMRIFESPPADDYLSVFGLWTEDDPRGPYEHFGYASPEQEYANLGGISKAEATDFVIGTTIFASAAIDEPRWYKFKVPDGDDGIVEFALDGSKRLRQSRLALIDANGNEVEMSRSLLRKEDEVGEGVFRSPNQDSVLYRVRLVPGTEYFAVLDVPAKVLSLRAEDVVGVTARRTAILRSLADIARGFGKTDGMRLLRATVYANRDGIVFGGDRILKALQSRPAQRSGASSFADAISQTGRNFEKIDGAKTMIGFATGAIFDSYDDLQFADRLLQVPVNFQAMFLSCNGLMGCPSERSASDFMRAAAVGSRGNFKRVYQLHDVEEAIAAAVSRLSKPVPFRLSSQMGKPASRLETIDGANAELLVLASDATEPAGENTAVSIVLDASGSMLQRMPGSDVRRIEVARNSLSSLVKDILSEGAKVSYRVFGLEKDACETKAFLPLGPLDKKRALAAIANTPAINLAKTPIAASLAAAGADLAGHVGPKTIVLITDGEETCEGNVPAAIEKLRSQGVDATLQIVGFAIDDDKLKAEFTNWARQGGGVYVDASDQEGLSAAVNAAAQGDYVVKDADGTHIGLGVFNEPLTLPAGIVFPTLCDSKLEMKLELANGQRTIIELDQACEN